MHRLSVFITTGVTLAIGAALLLSAHARPVTDAPNTPNPGTPVLVELFTSEGCSSCPPADKLLARIQQQSPSTIVLSEHVTYWNSLGWKDPFSSDASTQRQGEYVDRMHLESSYTPQMVVDGRYELVGSDAGAAARAIQQASASAFVPVTISGVKISQTHLDLEVETGTVPKSARLLLVIAQDEASENVANGENSGHLLRHVQVARSLRLVADVKKDAAYKGSISLDLPDAIAGSGWHVVVFLQQGSGGPILGAASHTV